MLMEKGSFSRGAFINGIGLVVVIYLVALLVQTVKRNNDLRGQISSLQASITELDNERQDLAYKINYYNTDDFREKEARAKLGLQMPGESVIILPPVNTSATAGTAAATAVRSQPNPTQWWNFLRGRS